MKIQRSQFKAMIKEIVRECIREVIAEQVVPITSSHQLPQQAIETNQFINPANPQQLLERQKLISQHSVLQQQLIRQQKQQDKSHKAETKAVDYPKRSVESGYLTPADRLRMAQQSSAHATRFDPRLDTPLGESKIFHNQKHKQVQEISNYAELPTTMKGSEDVMSKIFEDTLQTTYAMQAATGHSSPGHVDQNQGSGYMPHADRFAEVVAQHSPEELFEGAQIWSKLAFT